MNTLHENPSEGTANPVDDQESFDYTFVSSVARIALYDDLRSAPRVTEIMPAPTGDYIEALASTIYEQAKAQGGSIPYTVVREVSENFIHARFEEIVVSILDGGDTIRFTDQGPGIKNKDKAQLPGFSSAIEPMKGYIRGVGSGLPIVRDYLEFSHGTISIEDNMGQGAVVTISLKPEEERTDGRKLESEEAPRKARQREAASEGARPIVNDRVVPARAMGQTAYQPAAQVQPQMQIQPVMPAQPQAYAQPYVQPYAQGAQMYAPAQPQAYAQPMAPAYAQQPQTFAQGYAQGAPAPQYPSIPQLNQRERDFLNAFLEHGELGVTDLSRLTGVSASSVHSVLGKLAEEGLVEYVEGKKKRALTDLGFAVAESI